GRREHAVGRLPAAGGRARPEPGLFAARGGPLRARARDDLRGLRRPLRSAAPVRAARRRHGAPARRLPLRPRRGAHLGAARRGGRRRPVGSHLALQPAARRGGGRRRAALGGNRRAARSRRARRGADGAPAPLRSGAARAGGEAVARIVGEVESLGGHVKDLAGDGVLAFFGAPTTREDDAERAVRCALRIVGEMEEYAREVRRGWGAEGFGVRVGAATGAVVVGEVGAGSRVEYAAFGDTVNVAARLQSAAEPGSVLVDAATHHAVERLFEWGARQDLELKGKSEPVAAWP